MPALLINIGFIANLFSQNQEKQGQEPKSMGHHNFPLCVSRIYNMPEKSRLYMYTYYMYLMIKNKQNISIYKCNIYHTHILGEIRGTFDISPTQTLGVGAGTSKSLGPSRKIV